MNELLIAIIMTYCDNPAVERENFESLIKEYNLSAKQTALMVAIRLSENGEAGCEFGVARPVARRFAKDFKKSLRLQGQWCAGTIAKRYTGNLVDFCDKYWKPLERANWLKNVRFFMKKAGYVE